MSSSATPMTAHSATSGCPDEGRLDGARGQAVPGDVEDVVGAAHDEQVAVLVEVPAVAGQVVAVERRQVRRDVAVVVAPQGREGAQAASVGVRQMAPSTPGSTGVPFSSRTVDRIPGHRHRRGARLDRQRLEAPQVGGDGPPGLGLPPVVDDGDAEPVGRPLPRVGVQPLTGEEQGAHCRQVVVGGLLAGGVLLLDGPVCRRRREHRNGAVLGDDPEERAGVGGADRLALVEDGRAAREQRRVDDVGVADDPAHVAGGEPRLARVDAVDVLHRPPQRDRVAAVVADDALRLPGRAGRVEDVERVGRSDLDALGPRVGGR